MKNEQAYEEYNDTLDQIKIDETFLRNLKKKCSEKDEAFEKRMKDRIEEIKAVDDTIFILNSDAAFENFDKTVSTSFMQVSAKKRKSSLLKRAAAVLRNVRGGSVQLAALAVAVELDGFEKAKAAIDKMVADLT
jgi:predicted nuclease with TOPRIM domain